MRMKKRLMALVLAVVAAFALSGCTKMELTEYISKKGSYSSTMREYRKPWWRSWGGGSAPII